MEVFGIKYTYKLVYRFADCNCIKVSLKMVFKTEMYPDTVFILKRVIFL